MAGETQVDLLVNNEPVDSENITLSLNESTAVEFSHTEDEPGTYTIEVGGQTESYEVTEEAPLEWDSYAGNTCHSICCPQERRKY